MCERPRTTVPVGLLCPDHRCWLSAPSAFRRPSTTCSTIATGSTLTAVWPFQLPTPQSGTLSRTSSGTRPSMQTVWDVCLKRICSLDTSAFSALYKSYLLTYLLVYCFFSVNFTHWQTVPRWDAFVCCDASITSSRRTVDASYWFSSRVTSVWCVPGCWDVGDGWRGWCCNLISTKMTPRKRRALTADSSQTGTC